MKALLILLSLLMAFIAACSDPFESKDDCPCDVKLRELQEDGTYKRTTYRLQTLENPRAVSGSKVKVTLNPKFYEDGTTQDETPEAQYFINEDGTIVPTTTLSEELFSIYKIMEDFYFFDVKVGLDKIMQYPMKVSIHNKEKNNGERENAYYAPLFDLIVVNAYDGKIAPLGLNKGIMAHEHFHAIFNKIVSPIENTVNDIKYFSNFTLHGAGSVQIQNTVLESKLVSPNAAYNFLILKSLDEGLSDFWANLHTNLPNSFAASFSPEDKMEGRAVYPAVHPIPDQGYLEKGMDLNKYKVEVTSKPQAEKPVNEFIYGNGVRYSNLFKLVADKMTSQSDLSPEEKKVAIAQWIIESLKRLSTVVSAKGASSILSQEEILENFIPVGRQDIMGEICQDFNSFLVHHSKVASCSGR